jgi:hypothetical protein
MFKSIWNYFSIRLSGISYNKVCTLLAGSHLTSKEKRAFPRVVNFRCQEKNQIAMNANDFVGMESKRP